MQNIGIITRYHILRGKGSFYYPLEKWKKEFSNNGYKFHFFSSHHGKELIEQDAVIIDSSYIESEMYLKKIYSDKLFIFEFFQKLRNNGIKIILFDSKDGPGSTQFDVIEYVDVFAKKQVLKDKEKYLENKGGYSIRPFVERYNISNEAHLNLLSIKETYTPCPPEHLHKIKVGWNIGMCDYRYFPIDRFYSSSLKNHLNFIYKSPKINVNYKDKPIDTTFRGSINIEHEEYSYSFQRNKVLELLNSNANASFVTGPSISKRKYLNELKKSKTCISPFGHGEICYRDFEAIISGCVLIKPDMSHLITYPDIYKINITYVPIEIDMSDIESTLKEVIKNYDTYIPMIVESQKEFLHAINSFDEFFNHFKQITEYEV